MHGVVEGVVETPEKPQKFDLVAIVFVVFIILIGELAGRSCSNGGERKER